jgi:histone H3/H4
MTYIFLFILIFIIFVLFLKNQKLEKKEIQKEKYQKPKDKYLSKLPISQIIKQELTNTKQFKNKKEFITAVVERKYNTAHEQFKSKYARKVINITMKRMNDTCLLFNKIKNEK